MSERRRLLYLILIMTIVTLVTASVATQVLYRAALEEQRARLVETAQNRSRSGG